VAYDDGRTLRLRDWHTGAEQMVLSDRPLHAPVYFPDGKTLAVLREDGVELLQACTGRELFLLPVGTRTLSCLTVTSDGRTLVAGGEDEHGRGMLHFWSVEGD
jgi:hypothetical protein